MFEIHSIGDAAFLHQILNAVAMITGTGDFVTLCSIGILIGVIVICVQTVLHASHSLDLQQILVGWICWMCFFGVSTTVTIEDSYTGDVRVVDNVPLGVGFAGSLISNIGYGITDLFETAYRPLASLTDQPFAESLRMIATVRQKAYDASVLQAVNQTVPGGQGDIQKSLENYIRDCTMIKIQTGESTLEEIYTQPIDTALRFDSNVFGTRIYTGGGQADIAPSCAQAWPRIKEMMDRAMTTPQVIAALNRVSGIRDETGIPQTTTEIQDSMTMLGVQSRTAQDFVKASLIEPIYRNAAVGAYSNANDPTYALMVGQAINQRNVQWASEQSMFMTTVRPMLTFFEGFVYAITPVMGFLMVIGTFGLMLAVRYFQVVLWIQLWFPVMSVCNLYITMTASGQIQSMGGDMASFYGLNAAEEILQTWLSTGGMLCAATPMIALFLVTGSTYAFTTLANRMQGGDHVNEKMAVPDAMQVGAIHTQAPMATGNQNVLSTMSGGESIYKQLNAALAAQDNVSSTYTAQQQAAKQFSQILANTDTSKMTASELSQYQQSLGRTMSTSNNQQIRSAYDKVAAWGRQHNMTSDQIDAFAGLTALQAAGKISRNLGFDQKIEHSNNSSTTDSLAAQQNITKTPIQSVANNRALDIRNPAMPPQTTVNTGDISGSKGRTKSEIDSDVSSQSQLKKFGVDGSLSLTESMSSTTTQSDGKGDHSHTSLAEQMSFTDAETTALAQAVQSGVSETESLSLAKTFENSQSETLSKSATSTVSAAEQYQRAVSLNDSLSSQMSQSSLEIGSRIKQSADATNALQEAYNQHRYENVNGKTLDQYLNDRTQAMARFGSKDAVANRNAAMMEFLFDKHRDEFTGVLGKEMGVNQSVLGDAHRNSAIEGPAFNDPDKQSLRGVGNQQVLSKAQNAANKVRNEVANGQSIVLDEHKEQSAQTMNKEQEQKAQMKSKQRDEAIKNMSQYGNYSFAAAVAGQTINTELHQTMLKRMKEQGLSQAQLNMADAVSKSDGDVESARQAMYAENAKHNPDLNAAQLKKLTELQEKTIKHSIEYGDKGNAELTYLKQYNDAVGIGSAPSAQETLGNKAVPKNREIPTESH